MRSPVPARPRTRAASNAQPGLSRVRRGGQPERAPKLASHYQRLSEFADDRGNLPGAEEALKKTIALTEDKTIETGQLAALGFRNLRQGDLAAAAASYKKAMAFYESEGDKSGLAECYLHLGLMAPRGNKEECCRLLTKSRDFFTEAGRDDLARYVAEQLESAGCP